MRALLVAIAVLGALRPAAADDHRVTRVVDGDTIHVEGIDGALRLLGIDTEETFKSRKDREAATADLGAYMTAKRGGALRPVKMATPMGERAKQFAQQFFAGVEHVRIEQDDPQELHDRYHRTLAYVLVQRGKTWLNYNVECVRAGMSPYFTKYGNSRRYHKELLAAEAEARKAKRGIWAADAPGYPDYAEREAWWNARGAFVDKFRTAAASDPTYIDITHEDAMQHLRDAVGKQVVVLGTIDDVRPSDSGPTKIMLGHDFPLIVFDRAVLVTSGLAQWKGEFVMVTGVPTIYENKRSHRTQLEIVIDRSDQIQLSDVPGLVRP